MQVLFFSLALLAGASALSSKYFPNSFKFGASTAAYQIEGGWNEGGRGVSLWDDYVHTHPELIKGNATGDVACDSYHKYEEDIELLKNMKAQFYRLSISWVRIFPNGINNVVNQEGIDYYLKVLKLLKENNIEPIVTIYHWDLPISLCELGGWTNPEIIPYFGEYARVCFKYFGDYVKYWVTINEPRSTCIAGYGSTLNRAAPDYDLEAEGIYVCAYTHVKAHALAYHIYQDEFKARQNGKISLSNVADWFEPASNSSDDLEAQDLAMQFRFGLFAHPIFSGNWPQVIIDRVGNRSAMEGLAKSRLPAFTQEEIDYINGTYDWFGLNYYITYMVKSNYSEKDLPQNASFYVDEGFDSYTDPSWPQSSASTWLVKVPWGLRKVLNWVDKHYNHPEIIITENGWADNGTSLDDPERVGYTEEHLSSILDSIYEDGVNVTGYTHWSLMDNFEWSSGYTSKFGLVSVDFISENRTRTPKQSYYWYQNVISTRCLVDVCTNASSTILKTPLMYVLSSVLLTHFIHYLRF